MEFIKLSTFKVLSYPDYLNIIQLWYNNIPQINCKCTSNKLIVIQSERSLYNEYIKCTKQLTTNNIAGFLIPLIWLTGKFDFDSMRQVSPVLGPAFFLLYMFTVFFILVNMFLTILNESFASVRQQSGLQSNDFEIVDFLVGKLKLWMGYGVKEVRGHPI